MQKYPVSIIYNPTEVGSMIAIADKAVDNPEVKDHLINSGYVIQPVDDHQVLHMLAEKPIGIGCFLQEGTNVLLDEGRRERAKRFFLKMVPEDKHELLFDPIGVCVD